MGGERSAFEPEARRCPESVGLALALVVAVLAPVAQMSAAGAATATAVTPLVAQQAVPPTHTATLVRTTATSAWIPGSPDPAGVAWMPGSDRLVVVDSEVDETTGAGWNDVNIWFTQRDGTVTATGTAWGDNAALFDGDRGYSREPTGASFDPIGNVLFISDDSASSIFVVRAGSDSVFGNTDDVVTAVDTDGIGSSDTEDPVYDPVSGDLYFLDGVGTQVYRIDPVDGVFGNADDAVTDFDIGHLGPTDFEGLALDPARGTLYVGARTTRQIFEVAQDGTHLRTINVPSATGLRAISGLEVAPSSTGSGQSSLFIVDRAIDNGANASENDGRLYEVSAPDIGGPAPTVPGAPTGVEAVPGDGSAVVSWLAPVSDGGSSVTGYVVTPFVGAAAQSPVVFDSTATTQTVGGLTNGTGYSFRVAAVNAVGPGAPSEASDVVIPAPLPEVVPGGGAIVEGDTGTRVLEVPVSLSPASALPVAVQWSTIDVPGQVDYEPASGIVTFLPGETAKTVPVVVRGDTIDEANEWLPVVFSNATNATVGGYYGLGFGVIVDDDLPPSASPGGVAISPEGASGSTFWDLPVTLSSASELPVTIDWSTVDADGAGLAKAGVDFAGASGTLTFQPGETVQYISLEILGDTVDEPPLLWGEWGLVSFSNPTHATLDTSGFFGLGLFIIVDDDP